MGQKTCRRWHGASPVTLVETAAAVPFLSMAAFKLRHAPVLFSESRFAESHLSERLLVLSSPPTSTSLRCLSFVCSPDRVLPFSPMPLCINSTKGTENLLVSKTKHASIAYIHFRFCSTLSQNNKRSLTHDIAFQFSFLLPACTHASRCSVSQTSGSDKMYGKLLSGPIMNGNDPESQFRDAFFFLFWHTHKRW